MKTHSVLESIRRFLANPWYTLQVILLGIWVIFQYRRGNELYVIFLVLLFAALSILRLKNFTFIAASVLVIILFKTPVLDTWGVIKESNLRTFQAFKPTLSSIFTPNSGKEVLPKVVQQMLSLLEKNHIREFRLSSTFGSDLLVNQRITESAWPAKKVSSAKYLLIAIIELENYTDCTEVSRGEDVILVHCP